MHGVRLHKMSRRDAMARDPKRDLLGRDRDIMLRDPDETKTLRIFSETRPRRDVSTSRDRLETETSRPRPHPCLLGELTEFTETQTVYIAVQMFVMRLDKVVFKK